MLALLYHEERLPLRIGWKLVCEVVKVQAHLVSEELHASPELGFIFLFTIPRLLKLLK